MRSIRTKTIILNVVSISVTMVVATVISAISVANLGHSSAEQALSLLCETGKNNLNYYFKSVEQSVNTVSTLIDADLDDMDRASLYTKFHDHVEEARNIFVNAAKATNGVFTFYYRIDPAITEMTGEKGFWYVAEEGKGFQEHEVTDISDDRFECVWFYQPKETGKPMWLSPYVTDNLDVYVVSYNVPVYRNSMFIGVVGMEIDYKTMGEQIRDIKVLNSGFAFLVDADKGSIIYHPQIELLTIPEEERPNIPEAFYSGMRNGEHHIRYVFQGVEKHSYWLPLSNGMNIVVAVPFVEIGETWRMVVLQITIAALALIAGFTTLTVFFSQRFTRPLRELTKAAEEIREGNYNVELTYKKDDEIGVLTQAVERLIDSLGSYINDLSSMAYADALTSVGNKSAFDKRLSEIQEKLDNAEEKPSFAIAILDCDNLKEINDSYGHDKGDIYLRNSCNLICLVFQHSVVYRIGGDEFAVILEGDDFKNRSMLKHTFIQKTSEIRSFAKEPWEKTRISIGVAAYDPEIDRTAQDVVIHADHRMYENKRRRKKGN